jgi:uncharacterized membrane protein (DUF373 family)
VADRHVSGNRPSSDLLERCRATALDTLRETREAWPALGAYERFEQLVCLILTLLVGIVVLDALVHLAVRIAQLLALGAVDPANQGVFQAVFGMIMTVLIGLEFNHSVLGVLERKRHLIQVRTVVLIALLAVVRKFIVLDLHEAEPSMLAGLAAAVLALGAVHWLVRDQDRRDLAEGGPGDR